jgi:hypothetical protein
VNLNFQKLIKTLLKYTEIGRFANFLRSLLRFFATKSAVK